jgi:hypothetical protein
MDWIDVAQDKDLWRVLVNTVMNLRVPYNFGKFLSSCTTGGYSRRSRLHGVSFSNVTSSPSPLQRARGNSDDVPLDGLPVNVYKHIRNVLSASVASSSRENRWRRHLAACQW